MEVNTDCGGCDGGSPAIEVRWGRPGAAVGAGLASGGLRRWLESTMYSYDVVCFI